MEFLIFFTDGEVYAVVADDPGEAVRQFVDETDSDPFEVEACINKGFFEEHVTFTYKDIENQPFHYQLTTKKEKKKMELQATYELLGVARQKLFKLIERKEK